MSLDISLNLNYFFLLPLCVLKVLPIPPAYLLTIHLFIIAMHFHTVYKYPTTAPIANFLIAYFLNYCLNQGHGDKYMILYLTLKPYCMF